jgi:hypothetical protein
MAILSADLLRQVLAQDEQIEIRLGPACAEVRHQVAEQLQEQVGAGRVPADWHPRPQPPDKPSFIEPPPVVRRLDQRMRRRRRDLDDGVHLGDGVVLLEQKPIGLGGADGSPSA